MSLRNNPIYCLLTSPCRNMEVGPSTPYHTVQYLLLSYLQLGKGGRCRREIVRRPGYHSNLRPRQAAHLRVPAACDANEKASPTRELPCNPVTLLTRGRIRAKLHVDKLKNDGSSVGKAGRYEVLVREWGLVGRDANANRRNHTVPFVPTAKISDLTTEPTDAELVPLSPKHITGFICMAGIWVVPAGALLLEVSRNKTNS